MIIDVTNFFLVIINQSQHKILLYDPYRTKLLVNLQEGSVKVALYLKCNEPALGVIKLCGVQFPEANSVSKYHFRR